MASWPRTSIGGKACLTGVKPRVNTGVSSIGGKACLTGPTAASQILAAGPVLGFSPILPQTENLNKISRGFLFQFL